MKPGQRVSEWSEASVRFGSIWLTLAVAAVIVPIAPLLKTTVLRVMTGSKPNPLIVMVEVVSDKFATLLVTTGVTVATCTAVPLLTLLVVTIAVRLPADLGLTEKVTVSEVVVALVTVPTAPLLNVTRLLAATGLNPKPLIVMVLAEADRLATLLVVTGETVAI